MLLTWSVHVAGALSCFELVYVSDGDNNGVCRLLGTQLGRHEWVNPVLSGRLRVLSSSPEGRFTDPKARCAAHARSMHSYVLVAQLAGLHNAQR